MPKPAGQLTEVPVADLVPHPRNYRSHPATQIERIVRSLEQHGLYRPVVIQAGTNRIIAGHGVVEAAKQQGAETILAMVLEVSDAKAQQILIDDNALANHAEDDDALLADLLSELQGTEHEPAAYNAQEIEALLVNLGDHALGDDGDGDGHQTKEQLEHRWLLAVVLEQAEKSALDQLCARAALPGESPADTAKRLIAGKLLGESPEKH